jgi:hypothetical protein
VGFKASWIGFDGKGKSDVLEMVGLKDTGEPDEANEAPFSGAEIPGGWFILFSNNFDFVTPNRLARLSVDCRIVACQVHEGVMVSAAFGYERGRGVWELAHNAQQSLNDLTVVGSPPPSFEAIRRRLTQEQDAATDGDVDYIFDIPVEVAAAAVGNYRHDRWKFEWGQPQFTRLEAR